MKPATNPTEGSCYRFTVGSADQAASIIRERLGPRARVLSVKTVEASGLRRLWSAPRLEVVARVDPPEAEGEPAFQAQEDPESRPMSRIAPGGSPSLPSLLRRSGVSEVALGRLQCDPSWPGLLALPLHRALVEVGMRLKRQDDERRSRRAYSRAAFLGTAGAGRTTSLCKWLGINVFRNRKIGQVIMAEFDRPNPVGSLPMFCEALGIPFSRFPAAGKPAPAGGFLYFDMPALSLGNPAENAQIADFLARERIEQRVLVLNLAYDHATLRSTYAAGRALGATHLVFTHVDEVPQLGRAWEYLCDGVLEPLFLATGPSLTGDCSEDVWGTVIRRTLACAGSAPEGEESPCEAGVAEPAARRGARA
jgi:flagellar biosynthesis protein FlhF